MVASAMLLGAMTLSVPGIGNGEPIPLAVVEIDNESATMVEARTVPFHVLPQPRVGDSNPIPVGARAETLLMAGMMNQGWDVGLAHWGEHPETWSERPDQIYVGLSIGDVEVHYADGDVDTLPLIVGATAWFVTQWGIETQHQVKEPFASRPEYMDVLQSSLKLREPNDPVGIDEAHHYFYLAVQPRDKKIDRLIVRNNTEKRGEPMISGVTLVNARDVEGHVRSVSMDGVDPGDLAPAFSLANMPDLAAGTDALASVLYTSIEDLPSRVERIDFPARMEAARITFHGNKTAEGVDLAGMLSNYWVANLIELNASFDPETGVFPESGKGFPAYGGYSGFGTWVPLGTYHGLTFARCADHFVTMTLRALPNAQRLSSWTDYVDEWLYFFRSNHDPEKGPPNHQLDIDRYPEDAPGHWAFIMNVPMHENWPINELPGNEEMDGHGSTTIGRWWAWRLAGGPTGDWLMEPMEHRYNTSRYHASKQAANFICWIMDYTGRDVIYSEGESTGWGGGPAGHPGSHIPVGWSEETDMDIIRQYYQEAEIFFQSYPSWTCYIALRVSVQKAEAVGDTEHAEKWAKYADRLYNGLLQEMVVGEPGEEMWKFSDRSIFPSHNEALAQAFLSAYLEGYDHNDWEPRAREITRRTLMERLQRRNSGRAVISMGYGQAWMLHSALAFDEMDAAQTLVRDLAYYSWDKNMDHHDPLRGVDWRLYQWIFPEGTNILPDGRWHRIGDLSNGANQGPSMHALLYSTGVDDTNPGSIRILPRLIEPMNKVEVQDLQTVIDGENGTYDVAMVSYEYKRGERFTLSSDHPLPDLAVRLGPFTSEEHAGSAIRSGLPSRATTRVVQSGTYQGDDAWWIWVENLGDTSSLRVDLNR